MDEEKKAKFEELLWKKCIGRPNPRQVAYYYRKRFRETGDIPRGLHLVEEDVYEGRRASGRKRVFTEELKREFIEMVKKSVEDPEDISFVTEPLRKVTSLRDRLINKYGEEDMPALHNFYDLCKRERLWRFLKKPDYEKMDGAKTKNYFSQEDVWQLVQMDGCVFQTFEIRDEKGRWRSPQVIEIFDTGSRYMFALDVYWSESNLSSVDIFRQWMTNFAFPRKTIYFRPDNAGGFKNLERCLTELNRKHSTQGGFWLKPDYARSRKAKDKSHLESSHRALHNFELMILDDFKRSGAFAGSRPKTSFKTRKQIKEITVTRLDIDIEQLRSSGLLEAYRLKHNERVHRFSRAGSVEKWSPAVMWEKYMASLGEDEVLRFSEEDVEAVLRYGFDKKKATIRPDGGIQFGKRHYYVTGDTSFLNPNVGTPVKVSVYAGKLFIFEPKTGGAFLGDAIPMHAYNGEGVEKIEKKEAVEIKKNEFELILEFLKRQGMAVTAANLKAMLLELHKKGLKIDDAAAVVELHKEQYERYRNDPSRSNTSVAMILANLFVTHAGQYLLQKQGAPKIAPYASLGGS